MQDARRTGSRTALLHLSLVSALDDIAQDQAQRSRERLELARAQLPAGRFGALHLLHLVVVLRVACALGDYAWARATIDEMWPQFERSLVRHSLFAVLAYGAHARYLLNQHVLSGASGDPERLLRDDLRALHKFSDRVGPATHTRFRARLAYLRGDLARARELFEQHAEQCPRERFTDETERASWALGRVLGGQQGAELCARAVARLRERGVVDPEAEIGSHFPELIAT